MNQYPSRSQTTSVLRQHPKPEEMRRSRRAQFKADAKDLILFIGVSLLIWFVITVFLAYAIGG